MNELVTVVGWIVVIGIGLCVSVLAAAIGLDFAVRAALSIVRPFNGGGRLWAVRSYGETHEAKIYVTGIIARTWAFGFTRTKTEPKRAIPDDKMLDQKEKP